MVKKYACEFFNANNKNYDAYLKSRLDQQNCQKWYLKEKGIIIVCSQINYSQQCQIILKTLYNGKKIPLILPTLINNKLTSDFKGKANHFNTFFASQCTPISHDSTLPLILYRFVIRHAL